MGFQKRRAVILRHFITLLFAVAIFIVFFLQFFYKNETDSDDEKYEINLHPFYLRRHQVNCLSLMTGETSNVDKATGQSLVETDYKLYQLFNECSIVRRRFYYPEQPLTLTESQVPLAFSILAFANLQEMELLLSAIYMPQNVYCFHVDLKASQVFLEGMRRLARCFDNVVISEKQLPVSSSGLNMIRAQLTCIEALIKIDANWKYLFNLQGQDFPLRTNAELVEFVSILNGANDIELLPKNDYILGTRFAIEYDAENGVPIGYNLQQPIDDKRSQPDGLELYKGSICTTLNRQFAEKVMEDKRKDKLLHFLDNLKFGDEYFWATFSHNDPQLPGYYPGSCAKDGLKDWFSRYAMWATYENVKCHGQFRHAVCVFGRGDLAMLTQRPEMFLNKFSTRIDPLAEYCFHELLFNRTHLAKQYPTSTFGFNRTLYKNSAAVQFQNSKAKKQNFQCIPCSFNCQH